MGWCWSTYLLVLFAISGQSNGQAAESYIIDTLVVMDSPDFNAWVSRQPKNLPSAQREENARAKVKEYISLVIRQANLRLETLKDSSIGWTIELSVAGFSIGVDPLGSSVNGQSIMYQSALDTMKIWLVAQGLEDQYDYVILLTGYNLRGQVGLPYEIKGIANIGTLCNTDGTSLAVVEDRGGFQSVHFVAHEMGHSLGSKHDGESPNTACPESGRYLMAINDAKVTSSNVVNPWYFSSCSKTSIWNHLATTILANHPSCLRSSKPAAKEFVDTKDLLPGQVYDVRAQCKNLYGSQSNVCLGGKFKLEDVCTSMYCVDTSSVSQGIQCTENTAAEGSSCGTGKICERGRCVTSDKAPDTQFTDCYFGDAPVLIEGFTCSQYVNSRPSICYQDDKRSACCQSCNKVKRQSEACPFGDRKDGCSADLCQLIDVDGTRFEEDCCGTCGYDAYKDCVDDPSVDGVTCSERVNRNGLQECYDPSVAYHCCRTCAERRKNVTGCEYGDKTVDNTCRGLVSDEASCRGQIGKQCCQTCKDLEPDSTTTQRGSCLIVSIIAALAFLVAL